MEEKDIIAANIVFYRKKLGLSQLELAEKLCYSNKNISKWEKGETTPSIFTLKKLAEIFNISLDDLTRLPCENGENAADGQKRFAENAKNKKAKKIKTPKKKQSLKLKLEFLLMANAILLILAFIAIYVLAVFQVESFNKWLILLYVSPLSALSVVIFIRCVYKFVEHISLSFIPWLAALSLYFSNSDAPNIDYLFLVAAAGNLLLISIALLVNHHLSTKFKKKRFYDKPVYPEENNIEKDNTEIKSENNN